MTTRVAVFGAAGGIGRHLVPELVDRGLEVRAVSRSRENLEWDFGRGGADIVPADIEDREEQEKIFLEEGGAVARLPDFYGPDPGFSLLNDGLESLVAGDTVSWPGDPDAVRDFIFYPDAGRLLANLLLEERSYGEAWNVPGSGPETPRSLLETAARIAGRELRLRRIRRWMAFLGAPFNSEVRAFLDIMPVYEAPAVLDCSKLEGGLGEARTTDLRGGPARDARLDGGRRPVVTRPHASAPNSRNRRH